MHIRFLTVFLILIYTSEMVAQVVSSQTTDVLKRANTLQLSSKTTEALKLINHQIESSVNSPDDLSYLYAYQTGLYATLDSLRLAKRSLDNNLEQIDKAQSIEAKAVAYRAKAFLNNAIGLTDEAVKDAKYGLKLLGKSNKDLETKYYLNYLLYRAYSKWKNEEKMNEYIGESEKYALMANQPNWMSNVYNGKSTVFLAKLSKTNDRRYADSSFFYLQKSFALLQTAKEKTSMTSFVITCINIANYYYEHSDKPLAEQKKEAFRYLKMAEDSLTKNDPDSDIWLNIYGIKNGFAIKENNLDLAEGFLIEGLSKIDTEDPGNADALYMVYEDLGKIAVKKNNFQSAYNYQKKAEDLLKKTFSQQQIFNTQKLEVQYEIEKKNQQLALLAERAELRKNQNYLYGGLAIVSILGLIFMFRSYNFRLKYSIEREKKLEQEKEEAERNAAMNIKLEKEEQARLKAEQQLMELQQQQLRKEVLANNLMIEQKNETLKLIQTKIQEGDSKDITKLLKEEAFLNDDFEEVRSHIQQLHPNFFLQLTERSNQKLTPLDLKYCAYLYLKLSTKQIAQLLHVEAQSVRMFKYRLKQKFNLDKDTDLETFLQYIGT